MINILLPAIKREKSFCSITTRQNNRKTEKDRNGPKNVGCTPTFCKNKEKFGVDTGFTPSGIFDSSILQRSRRKGSVSAESFLCLLSGKRDNEEVPVSENAKIPDEEDMTYEKKMCSNGSWNDGDGARRL